MPDHDKMLKRTQNEKKPVPFRIEQETAEKIRALSKEFSNQDAAFNALIAAYEREELMLAQPQFSEDIRQFEEYQRCLSGKFTNMLNALATADERARGEVQQLLSSKDAIIQDLQKQIEKANQNKENYEKWYRETQEENKKAQDELDKERLVSNGLRKEMEDKESQLNSVISDKNRLNDILTKTVDEKQKELDKLSGYPELVEERNAQIQELNGRIRELEDKEREEAYKHRMEMIEKEKEIEVARSEVRKEMTGEMSRLREKQEAELEKLREKYEQLQSKMQDLLGGKSSK